MERAVALLRCFDGVVDTVSLTELANRTGLRVSTAHRIVRALLRNEKGVDGEIFTVRADAALDFGPLRPVPVYVSDVPPAAGTVGRVAGNCGPAAYPPSPDATTMGMPGWL